MQRNREVSNSSQIFGNQRFVFENDTQHNGSRRRRSSRISGKGRKHKDGGMTVVVAVGGVSSSRERAPWRVASIWACYEEDANGAEGGEASDTQRSNTSRLVPFQCDWCLKFREYNTLHGVCGWKGPAIYVCSALLHELLERQFLSMRRGDYGGGGRAIQ